MQAEKEKTAKQLADSGGIERGKFKKLSLSSPDSIGNDGVAVKLELRESLQKGFWRRFGEFHALGVKKRGDTKINCVARKSRKVLMPAENIGAR